MAQNGNIISSLPQGQDWLIERMRSLGYRSDDQGVCFGVAHMAMQAFLADDLSTFFQHLQVIHSIPCASFAQEIELARKKKIAIFANAKIEAIAEKKQALAIDTLSNEQMEGLSFQIHKKIETELDKEAITANKANSHSIRSLLDISAFFDEVELFQQAYHYPHLFEQGKAPKIQSALSAFELLRSQVIEKEQGIAELKQFIGCYEEAELKIYLRMLQNMSEAANFAVSFILNSGNHTLHIGYDRKENKWTFVDANQLSSREIVPNIKNNNKIINALSNNGTAIFQTSIFVTKQYKEQGIKLVKNMEARKEWQHLQAMTLKKNKLSDTYGFTILYLAASYGYLDIVKELITNKTDVHLVGANGVTSLYIAAQNNHLDIVKELIVHGADVNQAIAGGPTPLYAAAQNGYLNIVKELIANGTDVNQAMVNGITPLFIAAQNGYLDIVKELIANKANVNQAKANGTTPLYIAAQEGHLDIVKELIANGANINQAMADGSTPVIIAAQTGRFDIVKELIVHGADVNQAMADGSTPVIIAAQNGRFDIVKELIVHSADVNQAIAGGPTPLYTAAQNGYLNIVKALIANGADANQAMVNGITPLFIAAQNGYLNIVKALIANGADVNRTLTNGGTPLYIAAQEGHLDIVEALIGNGADVNQAKVNGVTPLYIAAQNGNYTMVKKLLAHGANLEFSIIAKSKILLDFAKKQGRYKEVEALLMEKKTPFFSNRISDEIPGFTVLHAAILANHPEIVRTLLENGADINKQALNINALNLARALNHQEIIGILESQKLRNELKNKSISRREQVITHNKRLQH